MERLTEKREGGAWPKKDWTYEAIAECLDRLAAIEDILGRTSWATSTTWRGSKNL